DGSTDDTSELLHSLKPSCALRIYEQPNRGQAAAKNTGLHLACGHLVLFLDDDVLCDSTLLREHIAAHRDTEPRIVFGPLLVAHESPRTLATDWMQMCTDQYIGRITRQTGTRWPDDASVFANSSGPRWLFLACGGFDERLSRALEDNDLGLR